jgi:hypothetical protein
MKGRDVNKRLRGFITMMDGLLVGMTAASGVRDDDKVLAGVRDSLKKKIEGLLIRGTARNRKSDFDLDLLSDLIVTWGKEAEKAIKRKGLKSVKEASK